MDLGILTKGGFAMIPLIMISVMAVAIIIERFVYLRKIDDFRGDDFKRLKAYMLGQNYKEAVFFLSGFRAPVAELMNIVVNERESEKNEIEVSVELEGMKKIGQIFKYLPILKVLPNLATLLGLLGTVTGMIKNFAVVSNLGTGDPKALASGISEALITTATGLMIAIPILFFYTLIINKANNIEEKMQIYASETLKLIK